MILIDIVCTIKPIVWIRRVILFVVPICIFEGSVVIEIDRGVRWVEARKTIINQHLHLCRIACVDTRSRNSALVCYRRLKIRRGCNHTFTRNICVSIPPIECVFSIAVIIRRIIACWSIIRTVRTISFCCQSALRITTAVILFVQICIPWRIRGTGWAVALFQISRRNSNWTLIRFVSKRERGYACSRKR